MDTFVLYQLYHHKEGLDNTTEDNDFDSIYSLQFYTIYY